MFASNALVYEDIYEPAIGKLSIGLDEKLAVSESDKIVCLGTTNGKRLNIATKPIAAVLKSTDIAGKSVQDRSCYG